MADLSPAEELRSAAKLMRSHAESATRSPWAAVSQPSAAADLVKSTYGIGREVADCAIEDAEHIASWHPAVALAVADWLDKLADFCAEAKPDPASHWIAPALKIARAYLGEC